MKKITIFILSVFIFINVNAETQKVLLSKCDSANYAYFMFNNEEEKIYFIGVNSDESYKNDICQILSSTQNIILEYDENKTDKYERLIAWIWTDKNLLQEKIIENGYGKVENEYKYTKSLCKIQKDSILLEKNIWKGITAEGYCLNVNYENEENNISFDNVESLSKIDDKMMDTINKLDKVSNKIDKIMGSKNFEKYLFYIIIILSIITLIYREIKTKK